MSKLDLKLIQIRNFCHTFVQKVAAIRPVFSKVKSVNGLRFLALI
jgi:hypothetical protein